MRDSLLTHRRQRSHGRQAEWRRGSLLIQWRRLSFRQGLLGSLLNNRRRRSLMLWREGLRGSLLTPWRRRGYGEPRKVLQCSVLTHQS
jgi:hypothetical protein